MVSGALSADVDDVAGWSRGEAFEGREEQMEMRRSEAVGESR